MLQKIKGSIRWPKYNLDESFGFALKGLLAIFKTQRNARIILLSSVLASLLGVYLKITI